MTYTQGTQESPLCALILDVRVNDRPPEVTYSCFLKFSSILMYFIDQQFAFSRNFENTYKIYSSEGQKKHFVKNYWKS